MTGRGAKEVSQGKSPKGDAPVDEPTTAETAAAPDPAPPEPAADPAPEPAEAPPVAIDQDDPAYARARLEGPEGPAITGHPGHVLGPALASLEGDEFTRSQVEKAAQEFLAHEDTTGTEAEA